MKMYRFFDFLRGFCMAVTIVGGFLMFASVLLAAMFMLWRASPWLAVGVGVFLFSFVFTVVTEGTD